MYEPNSIIERPPASAGPKPEIKNITVPANMTVVIICSSDIQDFIGKENFNALQILSKVKPGALDMQQCIRAN